MAKRDQRGRTRHSGKKHPSRRLEKSPSAPPHDQLLSVINHNHKRGHLYTPNTPSQHIKSKDENFILLSATTPMSKTISFICKRLNVIGDINAKLVEKYNQDRIGNTVDIPEPILQTVVVSAANSAMQMLVTIIEIIKRRCPTLLYNINIGTIDNSHRLQIPGGKGNNNNDNNNNNNNDNNNVDQNDKSSNDNDSKDNNNNSNNNATTQKDTIVQHKKTAYAIQVVFLLQEAVQLDVD